MNNRININLLLCEKCDDGLRNISNVFNEIACSGEGISFSIVVFINGVDCEEKKITLHYFLIKRKKEDDGKQKGQFIARTNLTISKDKPESFKKNNNYTILKFVDFKLESNTEYRIEVYMSEQVEINAAMDTESNRQYRTSENLMATYDFEVRSMK